MEDVKERSKELESLMDELERPECLNDLNEYDNEKVNQIFKIANVNFDDYHFDDPLKLSEIQKKFIHLMATRRITPLEVCQSLNIRYSLYKKWINENDSFAFELIKLKEDELENIETLFVESTISNKDLKAMMFYLKTQGKERGWSERYTQEEHELNLQMKRIELALLEEKLKMVRDPGSVLNTDFVFDVIQRGENE